MLIREAHPSDAPAIARLIVTAMTAECCAYFHGEGHTTEEFQDCIADLCRQEETQYSYRNTLIAEEGGQVAGAAVSYDGALLRHLRQAFLNAMLRRFGRDFSDITDETQAGELYLDSFAVFPEYRGRGFGKELLEATARKAFRAGIPAVGLLVDNGNPSAKRLYLSCGFRVVGTSTWGGHPMEHLQKPATQQR